MTWPGCNGGKLLINLNNALNALSGLPLRDGLSQRPWRGLLAEQMREALAVMKAEGIKPASSPLRTWVTPYVLELPDAVLRVVARRMVEIDPSARSSMWEDLERRRRTEIDYLQGLIVRLAAKHGLKAPVCERVAALILEAEAAGKGAPALRAGEVRGEA